MAGIEKSGFDASFDGLFNNASMILCKLNKNITDAEHKPESTEYNRYDLHEH